MEKLSIVAQAEVPREAKIVIGAIVLGLFLLIFLFWLSYRNAKKMVAEMKKLMIDKDLQEVNRKLDEILAKLK